MGHSPSAHPQARPASHLPPGFNALVDVVRERAAGDEAAGPLGHVQVAIFQHDLALADDHQRSPTQLQPFKDVILCSLETGMRGKAMSGGEGWGEEEHGFPGRGACLQPHYNQRTREARKSLQRHLKLWVGISLWREMAAK